MGIWLLGKELECLPSRQPCFKSLEDSLRQIAILKPDRPSFGNSGIEAPSNKSDLHEVVEVPCLQGSVLTIVGEAQEFLGLRWELAFPLEIRDSTCCDQRGGTAAAPKSDLTQHAAIGASPIGVGHAARQAEVKRVGDEVACVAVWVAGAINVNVFQMGQLLDAAFAKDFDVFTDFFPVFRHPRQN